MQVQTPQHPMVQLQDPKRKEAETGIVTKTHSPS